MMSEREREALWKERARLTKQGYIRMEGHQHQLIKILSRCTGQFAVNLSHDYPEFWAQPDDIKAAEVLHEIEVQRFERDKEFDPYAIVEKEMAYDKLRTASWGHRHISSGFGFQPRGRMKQYWR